MKYVAWFGLMGIFAANLQADAGLGTREILLDNQAVQVVRLVYPVGTESGVHEHPFPNRVAYFVKDGKLELIPADEHRPSTVVEVQDGDAQYVPAATHNVRNIGNTEIIIIETEIK